jgi:hypothetical protein
VLPDESVGLFLGAGASFELGMPLVWDLTGELKAWLTPDKLRELNKSWRSQGGGYSDAVIDDLAIWLTLPQVHYESILGHMETQFRRASSPRQEYHGLYSWLVELVYFILYFRHVLNVPYIEHNLRFIEGIASLAAKHSPLWIFSLNHDLIIECLAARYNLPLNCGFTADLVTLPRRNKAGEKTGSLRAETITEAQLEKGLPFFQSGNYGIDLLKIHGALDIFTFKDGKDLMRLLPLEPTVKGVLGTLLAANDELLCMLPHMPNPVKTTNEITYADEAGEMQFLRRSLLAGAYKCDARHSQVLPPPLLSHFQANLNYVSTLVCIGYGFGDDHINQVIRRWLEFADARRIEIVCPGIKNIPTFLLHLTTQVTLTDCKLSHSPWYKNSVRSLASAETEVARLNQEAIALRSKADQLDAERKAAAGEARTAAEEVARLTERAAGLAKQVEDQAKQNVAVDLQRDSAAREAKSAGAEIARLKERENSLTQKIETQTLQLAEQQKQLTAEFENIANRILKANASELSTNSQKALAAVLDPLRERIQDFQKKVEATYEAENREVLSLKEQIKLIV